MRANCVRALRWRASQVSNLQPPVLETGVLPIELDTLCWSPKQASNLHDFRRRILSPVRLPIPPSGVVPFRLCLHAIRAPARPCRHRCTWSGPTVHIPPGRRRGWPLEVLQRHTRNGAARGLRSLGLNVGDVALYLTELRLQVFCESLAPPVRGATRGKFLRITHRRHSAGEFTAARSLQWRPAPGAVRGCVRIAPHGKQKGPESTWESGPLVRELGRCALTRCLHPGAADPRTAVRATSWPESREGRSAANASWTSSGCGHHRTRRAQTPGPMRVECSVSSGLLSRWFQWLASSR